MNDFTLNFEANDKQLVAIDALSDDTTTEVGYGGGAGGGKSYLGVFWQWTRRVAYPGTRGFFGRKELKRLKQSTLATYFKFCQDHNIPDPLRGKYNAQDSAIRFQNGSEILLLDLAYLPSDPLYERFGSMEFTDGFIDESGEVSEKCIEILMTRVGRQKNDEYHLKPKILETFNPNKGHVYDRYYKPSKDGLLPPYRVFITALATDNPRLPASYIEGLSRASEVTKQRLLYGNFEYDDRPNKLFAYDSIVDCFSNPSVRGEKYIVGDVAGEGKDRGPIAVFDGYEVIDFFVFEKCSAEQYQDKVKEFSQRYTIPMSRTLLDQDGIGWGIVGNLHCRGFQNGSSPIDPRSEREKEAQGGKPLYQNLKTQCYLLLKEKIDQSKLNIAKMGRYREEIIAELDAYEEIGIDKEGPRKITPKEKVKEIIGRSPDFADLLAMRMWFDLAPEPPKKKLRFTTI